MPSLFSSDNRPDQAFRHPTSLSTVLFATGLLLILLATCAPNPAGSAGGTPPLSTTTARAAPSALPVGVQARVPTNSPAPPTATLVATELPTATLSATATLMSTATSTEAPTQEPATAAPITSAAQASTPEEAGVDLVLYRDATSLTLYLAPQGVASLSGLRFEVIQGGITRIYPLEGFNFGLPLSTLPTPLCLRLERSGSTSPLPIACDALRSQGSVVTRSLADANIFWQDGPQALPIQIYAKSARGPLWGLGSAALELPAHPRHPDRHALTHRHAQRNGYADGYGNADPDANLHSDANLHPNRHTDASAAHPVSAGRLGHDADTCSRRPDALATGRRRGPHAARSLPRLRRGNCGLRAGYPPAPLRAPGQQHRGPLR